MLAELWRGGVGPDCAEQAQRDAADSSLNGHDVSLYSCQSCAAVYFLQIEQTLNAEKTLNLRMHEAVHPFACWLQTFNPLNLKSNVLGRSS